MLQLKISSPAFVVEGESYSVRLTVTNQSFTAGVPVEAMLRISIGATVSWDTFASEVLIPTQEREEYFSANQTRTFDYTMHVPPGLGGYSGSIGASVMDPTGLIVLDSASEPLVVEAVPIPPEVEFSNLLIDPSDVNVADRVTLSVTVTNPSTSPIELDIDFLVNGQKFTRHDVPVAAQSSRQVTMNIYPAEPGTYSVEVGGLFGSFIVREIITRLFVYVGDVRYYIQPVPSGPPYGYVDGEHYYCGPADYQAFEVDVLNQGNVAAECILECYVHTRKWPSTAPWSSWKLDTNMECTLWEAYGCVYDTESPQYRVKRAIIQPGEIVTFRGLCWYHFFDDENRYIQAKFVGDPGEILSDKVVVEPYA